jgi:ParB/RepB/Spo0J family partition protein
MSLKTISLGRRDVHLIDPRLIVDIAGFNERTDYGDIATLEKQIEVNGITSDLMGRLQPDGNIGLIRGYRRMRCVRNLIEKGRWSHGGVPLKSVPPGTTDADLLVDQIVGNEGKPYTILEEGRVFARLLSEGLKKPEIAQRTGKTRTHVSNALALAAAPAEVIAHVEANHIAGSLVIDLIRETEGDAEKLVAAVNDAIAAAAEAGSTHATKKHTEKARQKKQQEQQQQQLNVNVNGASGGSADENAGAAPQDTSVEDEENADKIVDLLRADKPQHVTAASLANTLGFSVDQINRAVAVLRSRQVLGAPEHSTGLFPVLLSFVTGVSVAQVPEHRTDWGSVDGNAGAGGGHGGEKLGYDSTKNLEKLNKILEELPAEECDPINRAAVEASINFLEGKMDTKQMKSFLRL